MKMNRKTSRFFTLSLLLFVRLTGVDGRSRVAMAQAPAKPGAFQVEEAFIAETLEAIRTHRVTCRQLVERYLARIQAYDQKLQAIDSLPGKG